MAQTITQAQKSALSSGFLNDIGSNPEFSDLQMNESVQALYELAGYLIEEANKNLDKNGNVSSGVLASSHKVVNPQFVGGNIQMDIEALAYYAFINKGVRGTKSGNGLYSFKTDYPSKKMVDEIREWMKRAGISTRNIQKSVSKLESKRKSISQADSAYAMSRSIKMKGIKPTGYFDKAVKSTQSRAKDTLGQALVVDVINSLPKNLNMK